MMNLVLLIVLGLLSGCAASVPPMPVYQTTRGKECALECQNDYSDCMKLEVRPDYLIASPRKKACEKMIKDCYYLCAEQERHLAPSSNPSE
jgi:hypothetical protein